METSLAFPRGLLEETPQDEEVKTQNEAALNVHPARSAADKLYDTWKVYSNLVQDEKLWEIINKPREEDSEMFYLQKTIVQTADALGRILSKPKMVMDDLQYLHSVEFQRSSDEPMIEDCESADDKQNFSE